MIKRLPDDATLEDMPHHLLVLKKTKLGRQRLAFEGGIPEVVIEQALAKWVLV